ARLRFRTRRALERHDGLQVDLPVLGKPFGFAVDQLWIVAGRNGKRQEVFQAPAGAVVEVGLPRDHPELPIGAPVYCSSSQAVKTRHRPSRPKPGRFRTRRTVDIDAVLTRDTLTLTGRIGPIDRGTTLEARRVLAGPFDLARDPSVMASAARSTFEKLGPTGL